MPSAMLHRGDGFESLDFKVECGGPVTCFTSFKFDRDHPAENGSKASIPPQILQDSDYRTRFPLVNKGLMVQGAPASQRLIHTEV